MSSSSSSDEEFDEATPTVAGKSGDGGATKVQKKGKGGGYKHWTRDETKKLIAVWSEPEIKKRVASKKSRGVYEDIATNLAKVGVSRSGREVNSKIKNLTRKYKKVRSAEICCFAFYLIFSFAIDWI